MVPVRGPFAYRKLNLKLRIPSRERKNGRGAHAPRPPCQRRPTRQHYRPHITSSTSLPPPLSGELDKFVPTHPKINTIHIERRGSRGQGAVQRLDDEHTSITSGHADTAFGLRIIQHGRKLPPCFGKCEYPHGQLPISVIPVYASRTRPNYFAVGITNSAPFAILAGHRCITDFCLV